MFKTIESSFKVTAALFEVVGTFLVAMSKLYLSGVPVIQGLSITLRQEKYATVWASLDQVRESFWLLLTHIVIARVEIERAIKENPEDFKQVVEWGNQFDVLAEEFKPSFQKVGEVMDSNVDIVEEDFGGVKEWATSGQCHTLLKQALQEFYSSRATPAEKIEQ